MTREIKLGKKFIGEGQPAKVLPKTVLWVLLASLSIMAFRLAPAAYIFVLNHEQKQCAQFWPGDEYVSYRLPKPWRKAGADPNGLIQTPFGSCNLHKVNDGTISYETCCQKLGYTYIGLIEPNDKGINLGPAKDPIIYFCFFCGIPIAVFLFIVFLNKCFPNKRETTGV